MTSEVQITVHKRTLDVHRKLESQQVAVPILRAECVDNNEYLWSIVIPDYPMTLSKYREDTAEVSDYIKQLVQDKIDKMHCNGIFHGDLTAENVVLIMDSNGTVVDALLRGFDRADTIDCLFDECFAEEVVQNLGLKYSRVTEANIDEVVNSILSHEVSYLFC